MHKLPIKTAECIKKQMIIVRKLYPNVALICLFLFAGTCVRWSLLRDRCWMLVPGCWYSGMHQKYNPATSRIQDLGTRIIQCWQWFPLHRYGSNAWFYATGGFITISDEKSKNHIIIGEIKPVFCLFVRQD